MTCAQEQGQFLEAALSPTPPSPPRDGRSTHKKRIGWKNLCWIPCELGGCYWKPIALRTAQHEKGAEVAPCPYCRWPVGRRAFTKTWTSLIQLGSFLPVSRFRGVINIRNGRGVPFTHHLADNFDSCTITGPSYIASEYQQQ